ncbi:MAG: YggU family protein [Deltaproteobacteria bacterium]|nr:YggU family protein [Deltaproteobacteria bacterium]
MISIKETEEGAVFHVRVLPRASRCEIVGIQGDALKIKITAPPVDGKANDECIKFLSDRLGIKKARISIIAGQASKNKKIAISGATERDMKAIFSVI